MVDTYWQTETGGIVISALPGGMPVMPGSASLPFFGIEPVLMGQDGTCISDSGPSINQSGILAIMHPWPGIARTVFNNYPRYKSAYLDPYPGYFFTGDGATKEPKNGLFILTGRVDDVINVSGHRLSSCEIESALMKNVLVSEAAVLGEDDPITGQAITVVVALKVYPYDSSITSDLVDVVRQTIGPIATPKHIIILSESSIDSGGGLPKTRSGKIMRRILRIILQECKGLLAIPNDENDTQKIPLTFISDLYEKLGDLSTLNNPRYLFIIIFIFSVIEFLITDFCTFLNK